MDWITPSVSIKSVIVKTATFVDSFVFENKKQKIKEQTTDFFTRRKNCICFFCASEILKVNFVHHQLPGSHQIKSN